MRQQLDADDSEIGGFVANQKRGLKYIKKPQTRNNFHQPRFYEDTLDYWKSMPALMFARLMIADANLSGEIVAELLADVTERKTEAEVEKLIRSGELQRTIELAR